MVTQFEIDCALMAGRAYQLSRSEPNFFPVPVGWTEFFHVPNDSFPTTDGFEAVSFQQGTKIVIAYAGTDFTDFTGDWTEANIPLAFGFGSDQLYQAALYYLEVKAANPGATISFTGHSLGGGLAALMAVFFDEQAVTFDQAPFKNSSSSTIWKDLKDFLNTNGYSDSLLTTLVPEFMSYGGTDTRTTNVTGYYVEGEVLQYPPASAFSTIGTQTMLSQNSTDLSPSSLHSQTLLTAFLLNEAFRDLTFALPGLLNTLFDDGLYANDTATSERNFLENLLRHQIGVAANPAAGLPAIPADGMLDRFVIDLQKLTPDTYGTASGTDMAKALTVAAMEYHYFKDAVSATQLFTFDNYGLHFKYSDIGAPRYKSLPMLVEAVNAFLTAEEKTLLSGKLIRQDAWHIQSGEGGMIVNGGADNDSMIGGVYSDGLWGGAGNDILMGLANNDVLAGEKGNDYLLGGIGFDTYIINAGDGYDTILDSDGQGVVTISGVQAKGSATEGLDPTKWIQIGNIWQDQENGIAYALVNQADGGKTLLISDLSGSTVEIKDWSEDVLGVQLGAGVAPTVSPIPATTNTVTGDLKPADADTSLDGVQEGYDEFGNLIVGSEADPDREDVLYDSDADDHLRGLGGNDSLLAVYGVGNDLLEGGQGDDVLVDNYGADTLVGGEGRDILRTWSGGDDQLFADDRVTDLAAYIQSSETQTGSGQSGDWLSAGFGNDTLVGGTSNDILLGGQGEDLIIGGAGDDYIRGDEYGYADRGWTLTITEEQSGDHTLYIPNIRETLQKSSNQPATR